MSNKKVLLINREECVGCGACVGVCDELFDFDEQGFAFVTKQPQTQEELECAKDAIEACFPEAISFE